MKIKLNQDLKTPKGKKLQGTIIELEADKSGTPYDLFWRRRIEDSAIDNCVSIVEEINPKIKK
jgi:hypothetical protein